MHPQDPGGPLLGNVHFEVGAILRLHIAPVHLGRVVYSTLLAICRYIDVLTSLGEPIFEASIQALVQMVVLGITAED